MCPDKKTAIPFLFKLTTWEYSGGNGDVYKCKQSRLKAAEDVDVDSRRGWMFSDWNLP